MTSSMTAPDNSELSERPSPLAFSAAVVGVIVIDNDPVYVQLVRVADEAGEQRVFLNIVRRDFCSVVGGYGVENQALRVTVYILQY
jgi:hypothetical protein